MSRAGNCNLCGHWRKDVQSIGRDANGDPDAPDACFFCRKRLQEGRPPVRADEPGSEEDIRAFGEWVAAQEGGAQ